MTQERVQRSVFTDKFKQHIVDLVLSGKPQRQVTKEYDLSPSSLPKWIEQYGHSGSFKERDNLTDEQKKLIELRKQNKQLEMGMMF